MRSSRSAAPVYLSGTNFTVGSQSLLGLTSRSGVITLFLLKTTILLYSCALPTVISPSHTTPQLSQSQTVTSPVALNESDSSARSQDPPSVHPPQSSPPTSTFSIKLHPSLLPKLMQSSQEALVFCLFSCI